MTVVFTQRALRDLDLIFDYIAADSPVYARRQIDRLLARSVQIGQFPQSGRRVPELDLPDVREIIEGNYRIVYRQNSAKNRCDVLTIFHAARLLDSDL
ncbi:MAG TPA: type II toxin-antitoxin system RelE/ParE family toxin [Opitutales bacterium]|nr:type II toxin-antitoxin system RelE/ParE family toxin [Opitutales bacterium]